MNNLDANEELSQVTLMVMGEGQAEYLDRLMHAYSSQGIRWQSLVFQSGHDSVSTLHRHVSKVTTPFVMLALDSDFVLASALGTAVRWLASHGEHNAVHGYELIFKAENSAVGYFNAGQDAFRVAGPSVLDRLEAYVRCGAHPWRAVVDRKCLLRILGDMPKNLPLEECLMILSFEFVTQLQMHVLACTTTLVEYVDPGCTDEQMQRLTKQVSLVHRWDEKRLAACLGDDGFVSVRRFVQGLGGRTDSNRLFTSSWDGVASGPEVSFEPRQYVSLPYYDESLFAQLEPLELLMHVCPAGRNHAQVLEGVWVHIYALLKPQSTDTLQSLQARYWSALAAYRFNLPVCRELLHLLSDESESQRVRELTAWVERLERLPTLDVQKRLFSSGSGRIIQQIEASVPNAQVADRIKQRLAQSGKPSFGLFILDLDNDTEALQTSLDSVSASASIVQRIVVLKTGKLPAITVADSSIHFVHVSSKNYVAHLNNALQQTQCEWVILLQAGDQVCAGGLQRLQVELASSSACLAVAADEIHRDSSGRLVAVNRPGADLDLLRSRPDYMSRHWAVKRRAILDQGGFDAHYPNAIEMNLLLKLIEQHGLGCLQHMNEYLIVARQSKTSIDQDSIACLDRHFAVLGYRPHLCLEHGRIVINYRHSATPLVSIVIAACEDIGALEECLTRIVQRTRYPRYEIVVACSASMYEASSIIASKLSVKIRFVITDIGLPITAMLNLASLQIHGAYIVFLTSKSRLETPAWLENLLNHAQRPEVGMVGSRLLRSEGSISHAGFALCQGGLIESYHSQVNKFEVSESIEWDETRACQAVAFVGSMIGSDLFERLGRFQIDAASDVELCLQIAKEGLLILSTPEVVIRNDQDLIPDVPQTRLLTHKWPAAFFHRRRNTQFGEPWHVAFDA